MKKYVSLLAVLLLITSLAFVQCSKKTDQQPCNNKGVLCVENKMDTTVSVFIMPVRLQYNLQVDYINCTELEGNQPYTITVSKPDYSWDTTMIILPCDNKLLVVKIK